MKLIWTDTGSYRLSGYASEDDLEKAILSVQSDLFGRDRIYIDVKKKIGAKAGIRNIPDGYLLDLSGRSPRLFVVENELAAHDPLRHIAVQILQFSLSFEQEPRTVKTILFNALLTQSEALTRAESYALSHGFRNLDHMLEHLVFATPFAALVIIDEMPDDLQNILARKFQFGVEVLELQRYRSAVGGYFYHFEPFLADVAEDIVAEESSPQYSAPRTELIDVDTVVVPAREEGFREVFLGENRWHAVRIHGAMRPQIKYAAGYQVAPISAITHIAPVSSIEPWKGQDRVVINFAEPAKEIGPIPFVKGGRVRPLQNLRYTTKTRLEASKTLDDVW
jgi:hypothetical protein